MGDPQTLGKGLHKIHRPKTPWSLISALLIFSAISLTGLSSVEAAGALPQPDFNLVRNQMIYLLLGCLIMCGMYFIDFRKLQRGVWWLYGGAIAGIVYSVLYGFSAGGSRYFLAKGGFAIDFISYSPYILLIGLAGILSQTKTAVNINKLRGVWIDLTVLFIPVCAFWWAGVWPELLTYLICALVLYTWITGAWLRSIIAGGLILISGTAYVWNNQQIRQRITGAFNHTLDPDGSGYVYKVLNETFAAAGWRGHGFGARLESLPYLYTDMLPAYLINCFGWSGGLLLIAAAVWFFIRLFSAFKAVREPYGRAVILVLSLMLALRIAYGLSIISGKMVLTSLPFPFLNYGNHVLIEFAVLGLLMGIYRRKDIIPAQENERGAAA
ncbi:FtsW/RodA/SpoVE family cell cycle protein [Paenibacillus sp. FSL R7-0273]|nr:FtsW/RodA/SpoVE family cell cycle protein [Paenibacillus sp. FSL R7-0273]